ncbi:MAG: TSUP family transporter [Acidimicrobiales bacterium]
MPREGRPRPALDTLEGAFLEAQQARTESTRRRGRLALVVPLSVTVAWAAYVSASGQWGRVGDNVAASVTMVFGSFVAGSTPQGGGAVAFPVFTKVLEVPAEVARSFSLSIQTVGMGAAALAIVVTRRAVEWRAVAVGIPVAATAFVATLVLAGDAGQPFWPSRLPGPYVKVTFTLVLAAMAWLVFLAQRVPVRKVDAGFTARNARLDAALVLAAVAGGVASALVGSGADVVVYLMVVLILGVDARVGVPTSVLVMASVSAVGFVVLGLLDGQLATTVVGDAVTELGGAEVALVDGAAVFASPDAPGSLPLPADRFDLFGMWIAAAPVVAWGAPLGSWAAARVTRTQLVRFVLVLAVAEIVSTAIFLDELHSDPALVAYGVVGLAVAATGLTWVAGHRNKLFGLPGVDGLATLRRTDLEVDSDFSRHLRNGDDP